METTMLADSLPLNDGVVLARTVRAVAASARRTLKRPYDRDETRELMRAVDALQQDLDRRQSPDLSSWLVSLRSRIEQHGDAFAAA